MSRSNQIDLVNPATRFFQWSGSEGKVQYYDKTEEKNVDVKMPFTFLVLDRVAQITGGVDHGNEYLGFWSNAVRNTKVQPFTVRSKRGIEVQGLYEQIKGYTGVRFQQGLYIAYKNGQNLEIGYLKIKGAALTAWIEFTKAHRNIFQGAFSIVDAEKKKKGATTYYEPVFDFSAKVSEETESAAIELDKQLQEYLTAYFAQQGIEEVEQAHANAFAAAVGGDGVPDMPAYSGAEPEEQGGFDPSRDNDDLSIPF